MTIRENVNPDTYYRVLSVLDPIVQTNSGKQRMLLAYMMTIAVSGVVNMDADNCDTAMNITGIANSDSLRMHIGLLCKYGTIEKVSHMTYKLADTLVELLGNQLSIDFKTD